MSISSSTSSQFLTRFFSRGRNDSHVTAVLGIALGFACVETFGNGTANFCFLVGGAGSYAKYRSVTVVVVEDDDDEDDDANEDDGIVDAELMMNRLYSYVSWVDIELAAFRVKSSKAK